MNEVRIPHATVSRLATLPAGSPTPFDGQAPDFDRRVGLPEADCRAIAAAVLGLAGVDPSGGTERGVLLEIGAGTGLIGRWFLGHNLHYVGCDLSRGMLEVFRHRLAGLPGGLVQADGSRPWPLPDGSVRMVFSSRAIHLLPAEHVVGEMLRVGRPGAFLLLGRVERRPESVQARLAHRMRELVRERGFEPKSAGGRRLLAALRQHGAAELSPVTVVRWPARHSPAQSLDHWRAKSGLGGVVLPPGVQEEILAELEAWALSAIGPLDAVDDSEQAYVLEGVRLH